MKFVIATILACVVGAGQARAVTANLQATADNTLIEDPKGLLSNGSGTEMFAGRTGQASNNLRRGLVKFETFPTIPIGAVVDSVRLRLNMSRTNAGPEVVTLHRCFEDWGQGASDAPSGEGQGAVAQANDATWVYRFFPTDQWSTIGGSFNPEPSASLIISDIGAYFWASTDALVLDVQRWVGTPSTNFGWVIVGDEGPGITSKRFDTHENGLASTRPVLIVNYHVPVGVPDPRISSANTTWGRVKADYHWRRWVFPAVSPEPPAR